MHIVPKEEIEPAPNPNEAKSVLTDAVAFGGGAVVTNIVLESVTLGYMNGVAPSQKQNTGYMLCGGKVLAGLIIMWASSKYISSGMWKKLGYGISVGFFVSASNDAIEAYAYQAPAPVVAAATAATA